MVSVMRIVSVVVSLALSPVVFALPAAAQDGAWGGYYVGAGVATTGGRTGDFEAAIDPALHPQINYLGPSTNPTFSRERNMARADTFEFRAGRLIETGQWVLGLEARVNAGGPDETFHIRPVMIHRTDVLTQQPIPFSRGDVYNWDSLKADLHLDGEASIRARIGASVGDRFMVSAFAGPTVTRANFVLRQDSTVSWFLPVLDTLLSRVLFDAGTRTFSATGEPARKTLIGAVVGAGADMRLNEHWRISGEASLARYDGIEATVPAYGGSGSHVSYEPTLYSLSVSLIRRF